MSFTVSRANTVSITKNAANASNERMKIPFELATRTMAELFAMASTLAHADWQRKARFVGMLARGTTRQET